MTKLTPKQQRFVQEYLVDLNATAAYHRAGYRASTRHVGEVEASKTLRKPEVAAAIAAAGVALPAKNGALNNSATDLRYG